MIRRVAVFASSVEVASPDELGAARKVGRWLPERSITLVTDAAGGGPARLLAEVALEAGGRVVGVLEEPVNGRTPAFTEERRVQSAEQQRREMLLLADAVLALPGAFTRLEDVLDLWTLTGGGPLPVGLLDEGGFYSGLLQSAGDEALDRFVRESQRGMLVLSRSLDDLMTRLDDYRPPETRRSALVDES